MVCGKTVLAFGGPRNVVGPPTATFSKKKNGALKTHCVPDGIVAGVCFS
jgi:hypothetical protein